MAAIVRDVPGETVLRMELFSARVAVESLDQSRRRYWRTAIADRRPVVLGCRPHRCLVGRHHRFDAQQRMRNVGEPCELGGESLGNPLARLTRRVCCTLGSRADEPDVAPPQLVLEISDRPDTPCQDFVTGGRLVFREVEHQLGGRIETVSLKPRWLVAEYRVVVIAPSGTQ